MTRQSFLEQVPTYASLISVAFLFSATWQLNRMRHHSLILFFLGIQFLCGVVVLAALIAGMARDSKEYRWLFALSVILPLALAWTIALRWALELPQGTIIAILLSLILPVGVSWYLCDLAPIANKPYVLMYAVIGSLFVFPGMLSVMTTAGELNRAETMVHLGLSAFWLMFGLYAYAQAAGLTNPNLKWMERAWFPSVLAIVCFGILAVNLNRLQLETSRVAVQADVSQEMAR